VQYKKGEDMTTQYKAIQIDAIKPKTVNTSWLGLYKVGGTAALITGILLSVAMISLISSVLHPGVIIGWLAPFQNNWLIVIFKLHAGFSGVKIDQLHNLDYPDIAILALVGTMALGLYGALRKTSRFWALAALALPFLGIILFITTKTAGRSAVMGVGLIISIVMLRNKLFNQITASVGILASVLLLAGDFSAGVLHSIIITTLFGSGYVLLIIWIFLTAYKLFQL
jgi:hypothetical protein